ncbi:hypothetical protein ST37_10885 [Vibrio sp. qd031]|uniref:hypothetical protein n=1 Tax=Vibrio sp. qd031 TaxID=1603038 RepID=UPI000A0F6B77|nr:hypothetical protein [Vibrio sp. qd031]ORT50366.1 hypothetical protein ST37_10885 [Vibrio sp. qd031]
MNRINGLPSQVTPLPKSDRSKAQSTNKTDTNSTHSVMPLASKPIRMTSEERINQARVQYDLPEGSSRQAMQEYLNVANQARREELEQLVGVDLYI